MTATFATAFQAITSETDVPKRPISDAERKFYLRRARRLRAEAFHETAAGLRRGLLRLGEPFRYALAALQHNKVWRAPGSGNCLNC